MFMKILLFPFKLLLKILMLPILLITGAIWLIAEIVMHLGSLAYMIFTLFILYVIFHELMIHERVMAGIVFALECCCTAIFFGATVITMALSSINQQLFGFIF